MESPENKGGLKNPGRRSFLGNLGKLGAVAGAVALGGITSKVVGAETVGNQAPDRSKEPERSKNDLEVDYKVAEIEKDIISQFNSQDIKNIVKGQEVQGIDRLYMERYEAGLNSKLAAIILIPGGALAATLWKQNKNTTPEGSTGIKNKIGRVIDDGNDAGAALIGGVAGTVATAAISAGLILPKHDEMYLDVLRSNVREWIHEKRKEGRFETEVSTKEALQERYKTLIRKQNEIRKKLDKM